VTVKIIEPTVVPPTVAVNCMLLGALLAVAPTRVTEVVVVMVMVEYPFPKVAEPVPLVVDMVKVIGSVLVEGFTVAVVWTGFPSGTNGVSPKVTLGVTLSGPLGPYSVLGHLSLRLFASSQPRVEEEVEPTPTPV